MRGGNVSANVGRDVLGDAVASATSVVSGERVRRCVRAGRRVGDVDVGEAVVGDAVVGERDGVGARVVGARDVGARVVGARVVGMRVVGYAVSRRRGLAVGSGVGF